MVEITTVLVDKTNYEELKPQIIKSVKLAKLIGIDTETHNANAHAGILEFRKENETRVFDYHRMVITGLSIYPDVGDTVPVAYYFNLNHADVDNRLTWEQVKSILDEKNSEVSWIAHNAVYELTVLKCCYNYDLENIICTMQMAVSAWGPDEYDPEDFIKAQFGEIATLFPEVESVFKQVKSSATEDLDIEQELSSSNNNNRFTPAQQQLLSKVLGKQSIASFSYNGLVSSLAYSYGLKKIVKKFFSYQMGTYEETLKAGEASHMGELTGEQVKDYGAEDAYWTVAVFYYLYTYMSQKCPESLVAFFGQENPMVHIFADSKVSGMKVNQPAIALRRDLERENFAECLRDIKATINSLLPFKPELNIKLAKYDKWYAEKGGIYRDKLIDFAKSPDSTDTYTQVIQVSSPVSNAWVGKKCAGLSIGHYYQTRIMMYDLCRIDAVISKGKVQSDADTRGLVKEKVAKLLKTTSSETEKARLTLVDHLMSKLTELSSIEQRMKLYLTPYTLLTDPDTGRMYPELSASLATRRMSCNNPNAQQLTKRGESVYVRGFFEADSEDELLVSLDWSQVELVLIGEFSGDPEFAKAYGKLPYEDLHLGAAADVLSVVIPGVTPELMTNLHTMKPEEIPQGLLVKPSGELLSADKAKKYWRTEVGKGANFNYWYSGALSSVADVMGWTSDQMWTATEAYRERFAVAEEFRVNTINFARENGYVQLPDGHRRVRWEATYHWTNACHQLLSRYVEQGCTGVQKFMQEVVRATRSRAGNQIINALIQGSSAALTKRSILTLVNKDIPKHKLRAKFKLAIHDEIIFSVHKDDVIKFISVAKEVMTNHPDIVKNLKLYCTASIGKTFEPYNSKSKLIGQIELDECPNIPCVPEEYWGKVVPEEYIPVIIDWIYDVNK